jgi:hypothetical protein
LTVDTAYHDRSEQVDPRFASVDCVFFVIGAQKAGTTWLSRYFREHPNVSVPFWKEHNYWNQVEGRPQISRMLLEQERRREKESNLRKVAAMIPFTMHSKRQRAITLALRAVKSPKPPHSEYADVLLENVNGNTGAAGELCPQYALLETETFATMAALSDNVRFIYMLRDPLTRTISGAQHNLRKRRVPAEAAQENLSELLGTAAEQAALGAFGHSGYHLTINRLEQAVPRERILYVFFEELFDQQKVRDICQFIGVPFVPGDIGRKRNVAGKAATSAGDDDRRRLARALKPVYDFAFDRFGAAVPAKWRESAALC